MGKCIRSAQNKQINKTCQPESNKAIFQKLRQNKDISR